MTAFPHHLYKDAMEIVERRTPSSKVFDRGNGKYSYVGSRKLLHKFEDGKLVDLDTTPKKEGNKFHINGAGWSAYLDTSDLSVIFYHEGETFEIYLIEQGVDTTHIEATDTHIKIRNAFPGVDLILAIRPEGLEWYKNIHKPEAKHSYKWYTKQSKDSHFKHRKKAKGFDSKGNKLTIENVKQKSGDGYIIEETGEVKAIIRDKKTRIPKSSDELHYPLMLDVPDVSVSVAASGDDGNAITTGTTGGNITGPLYAAQTLIFAGFNYATQLPFFRFDNIGIPAGATIDDAKIILRQSSFGGGEPSSVFHWYVVNTADPATPSNVQDLFGNMGYLTTPTDFVGIVTPQLTGGFTSVEHPVTGLVQMLIDLTGWASNNAMLFGAANFGTPTAGVNVIAAYDHPTEAAPLIEINYTASGGGTTVPIFLEHLNKLRRR